MNELIVVLGPAGMEREAIRKSVELTREFKAVTAISPKELARRKVDLTNIACVLQMYEGKFKKQYTLSSSQHVLRKILVETTDAPDAWLIDGLRNGAVAVIAWPCLATELRAALQAASEGAAYLTPRAGGLLVGGIRNAPPRRLWELVLTPREREVARRLRAGKSNKEIAESLGIAESTVECHLTNIFRKLQVQSRAEAAVRINRSPKQKAVSFNALTSAEQQVVEAVLQGLGNDDIADRLQLSRHTVETHLTHAYQKLGVRNRTELIARQAEPV